MHMYVVAVQLNRPNCCSPSNGLEQPGQPSPILALRCGMAQGWAGGSMQASEAGFAGHLGV